MESWSFQEEMREKKRPVNRRTGRINLSGWKGELPRGSKKVENLELLGAKGWKTDILQEVNVVRGWSGKTQAALL